MVSLGCSAFGFVCQSLAELAKMFAVTVGGMSFGCSGCLSHLFAFVEGYTPECTTELHLIQSGIGSHNFGVITLIPLSLSLNGFPNGSDSIHFPSGTGLPH